MSASERRAEIMRILVGRRKCYLSDLAQELGVSKRTIQRDVQTLVLQYPLESIHGNGGGIRLADWYHPHRNILSQEQIRTLRELSSYADEQQKKIVQQIISAYGTNTYCSVLKTKE